MTIKNNNRQKPRLDVFVVKTMQMKTTFGCILEDICATETTTFRCIFERVCVDEKLRLDIS